MNKTYDIIIAGAGLSGLTLAVQLAQRAGFRHKNILLIDREVKNANDRTWCFWAKPDEPLPPVVHRIWPKAEFHHPDFSRSLDMGDYRYHMIRSADFYRWAHSVIDGAANFTRIQANIRQIDPNGSRVETDRGPFSAPLIFNSAIAKHALTPEAPSLDWASPFSAQTGPIDRNVALLQHFKGWFIQTRRPTFQPDRITLMDYRTPQEDDTRFVYVLPFSETEALIEYTIFSEQLLEKDQYDAALHDYISNRLNIDAYDLLETEFGVIPMTDAKLRTFEGSSVVDIGSVSGAVKASSGYAFIRIQRKIARLAAHWEKTGQITPGVMSSSDRFQFYDGVLLRVLNDRLCAGNQVFGALFRRLPAYEVFRFLDEDSSFLQDLRIINAMPKAPFLRAAMRRLTF